MPYVNKAGFIFIIASLLLSACNSGKSGERWYNETQVIKGKKIYLANCISCHLDKGAGSENWKVSLEDGSYPPPPLNGKAHTWHHSTEVITKIINEGGAPYDGHMPPFKEVLNEEEITSVISYIQSLWSDEIYEIWKERDIESRKN